MIPVHLQELLRPWFPNLDLATVKLIVGRPFFLLPGFEGITLGRHVWAPDDFHRRSVDAQLHFLAHELAHVEQYQAHGRFGFLRRYLGEYLRHRRRGMAPADAYAHISFEEHARRRADTVVSSG